MRAIIVEDESFMMTAFDRMSANIEDLKIVGRFDCAEDAVEFSEIEQFEIAFLDIELPEMNGIECAKLLRKKNPGLLVVFITAYDNYIRESNQVEADYYLLKPYKEENLRNIMENMKNTGSKAEKARIYRDLRTILGEEGWNPDSVGWKDKGNSGTDCCAMR